jgi:uncharacterized protein with von Willebrand factor type A (vWA) domain
MEHLELSETGRKLVKRCVDKQGEPAAGFPADLHSKLYLPVSPDLHEDFPEWAGRLLDLAGDLGEWHQLKLMTARNGFAAGIAAEVMLDQLIDQVPDAPEADPERGGGGNSDNQEGEDQQNDSGQQKPDSQDEQPQAPSDSDIRAALRKATRSARDAVADAESALEGMGPCLGGNPAGNQFVQRAGPADLKAIRDAHERLKSSGRLQEIAKLAGRFERVAASKARSKVKPGVGEIHGVGLGDDIARLLPSELVALKHPKRRLVLLSKLVEKRALTYEMQGREPQARGPILVLLDESSSMRTDGKDIWSKAVALALLSTATIQRRAFHLVAFNAGIRREVGIEPGKATPADIARALDERCAGGTNFGGPILRAVEIIRTSRIMKNADVVVITDGQDGLDDEVITAATELTRTEGVSFYVVGVGDNAAKVSTASLGSIATEMVVVRRTADSDELIAPVVNLDRGVG